MNSRVSKYLVHPENRMHICRANRALFTAKGNHDQAEEARVVEYIWLAKAETHDLSEHY